MPQFSYGGITPIVESFGLHADGYTFVGKASGAKEWSRRDPLPVEDYLFWVLRFEFDFGNDKLDGNIDGQTDWKWKGIYPNGNRGPEHIIKLGGKVGTDGKFTINGTTRVSGTWPVDLGIFSGSDGWNVSSDSTAPPATPSPAPRPSHRSGDPCPITHSPAAVATHPG